MRISDWSSDVCSSDLNLAPRNQRHAGVEHFLPQLPNSPSTAAARPIQTAITSPIPAALLHSKIDCLPLGWSIGRRRKSFPNYHGCTLIHKSTPYFAFSSSALLALGNCALLGLSLAGKIRGNSRNTIPIAGDRPPAIGPFFLR